ncbi:MAG: hypothetical protein K2X86_01830, partial [Cytophagaceae bacterium]|nr:hypothetical protein [Cytophagaceae bacterium]
QERVKYYSLALSEIREMLEGKKPLQLKRAVYLVENAYYDNKLNYEDYCKKIDELILFCRSKLKTDGYKETDKFAKNFVLYKLYTSTIERKDINAGMALKHYPIKYDFEDFWGSQNWTKQFVVKTLYSNSGQCHSLPLLYMILAQEFGTEAYLSFSPNHSYIKFKDNNNCIYNFETTNGHMVTDKWIMASQYVKSEAVQNGLYMDTLNFKQTVAHCLNDLADGFQIRFGFADGKFLMECSHLSLKYFSKGNYHALATKSNLYFGKFDLLRRYNGIERTNEAINKFFTYNKEAKEYWDLHDKYYSEIRSMGYEDMPADAYLAWLKSVEAEKEKNEHSRILSNINKQVGQ